MSMTYADLKQAIQDYTENSEATFVSQLPLFIRMAEEKILKQVNLNVFRKSATAAVTTGTQYLPCPTDFLAPLSLSVSAGGEKMFLEFKDLSFVQEFGDDTPNGVPRYYATFDVDNFTLAPTPDQAYSVQLNYLYRPASITAGADSGTTWISENAELALLYCTLLEAYTFMKGEQDMMQLYAARAQEAIQGLKQFGEANEVTDEFFTGVVMRPKQ